MSCFFPPVSYLLWNKSMYYYFIAVCRLFWTLHVLLRNMDEFLIFEMQSLINGSIIRTWKLKGLQLFKKAKKNAFHSWYIFCYQNCSDLLWEKIALVIKKTFEIWGWRWRIFKIFEITRTIYSNSERSEQFLVNRMLF